MSTAHDRFFATARRAAGRPFQEGFYHYRGRDQRAVGAGSQEEPLVYALYGSTHEPQSLVVSETDLLEFLTSVASGTPALPPEITSKLRDTATCFLFLGFRFRHWYLRILPHTLQGLNRTNRSFALEKVAADDPDLDGAVMFFQESYKIYHFRTDHVSAFVHELARRFEEQYPTGDPVEPPPGGPDAPFVQRPGVPTAFLCFSATLARTGLLRSTALPTTSAA